MAVTGSMIGQELCKALGLDIKGVRTIDIHVDANEAVTVTVKRLESHEQMKELTMVLEKYHLHPAKDQQKIGGVTNDI